MRIANACDLVECWVGICDEEAGIVSAPAVASLC